MTTRSKTGSLTPKVFTDSVTLTTNSSKSVSKHTEEVMLMNKDGEITRISNKRTSVTSTLSQQNMPFKLGKIQNFKEIKLHISFHGLK